MALSFFEILPWLALPAAFALDAMVGDPRWLPHPVRWMGRAIELAEPFFRKHCKNEFVAGGLFAVSLIFGCWALSALILGLAYRVHGLLGFTVETVLLFYCLSARSLSQAGMEIHQLLA